MDHNSMVAWAEKVKARCEREGLPAQQTRDYIYNSALVMFSGDDITPADVRKAERVVKAIMPGVTSPAIMGAFIEPNDEP